MGQIADEHLWPVVHVQRDDVEVTVVIQVKDRRSPRTQRLNEGYFPGPSRAVGMVPVGAGTIEDERHLVGAATGAWFNAEDEFAVEELLSAIIEEHRIDAVSETETHSRGNEYIFVSIGI